MESVKTEWAAVSRELTVVARQTGEAWLLHGGEGDDASPFRQAMTGAGSRGSTMALLDMALSAGFGDAAGYREAVPITPVRYAYDLVDAYHNSHMTTRNYRHAAARFRVLGRPEVSAYLEKHAREETGHDRLALKDLRALGIPAEQVVENLVPEGKRPLWRRFDRLSFADYPLGCIGFSYSFERLAAFKSKEDVDTVRAILPPGIDATRFLRAHSSLGSEVVHAEDLIDFISSLPADDRTAIAKATYGTALLMGAGNLHNRHKPEAEMWSEIEAAAGEPILLAA